MKKYLLPILVLIFSSLIISCKTQSAEDKLAIRLSKSKNFNEWEQSIVEIKNQLTALNKDTAVIRKYKNLTVIQQRDSMTKILMKSDNYIHTMNKMIEASKKTKQEFPELSKLSKESEKKVWLKASAIIIANQSIK